MEEKGSGVGGSELTGGYRSNPLDSQGSDLNSQGGAVIEHGGKVLSDGRPMGGLSLAEARAELRGIEAMDSPLWSSDMPYWERQKLLKRRDEIYRRIASDPETKKGEQLGKEKFKESFQREVEKYEERDAREVEEKLEERLIKHFGGEKEANGKVKSAQALVKAWIRDPKDLKFLDDSGIGNDFEVIGMIARLHEILEEGRARMKKSKKGGAVERKTTELTQRGGGK